LGNWQNLCHYYRMARTGITVGNPQFQMGPRLKKFALFLALALTLSTGSASGATKKPTPKPTVKVSTKATVKATAKSTAKSTTKTTTKATTTAKPSAKPKPKPKPKPRKKRKKIRLSPSPRPKWPPIGFVYESGVFAKVPTSKQLVGVISASGGLSTQIKECSKVVCGAVQVAAEQGCLWWEVNSQVFSREKVVLGNLRTISGTSGAQKIKTILLVSPEPIETLEYISEIEVVCHQDAKPEGIDGSTYVKVNG